jgi:hypothetical protein
MDVPTIPKMLLALREMYEHLKTENAELADQQQRNQAQMKQLLGAIEHLAALTGQIPEFEAKLADGIRAVLATSNRALFPAEVRDRLKAINYDFSEYKNPLASIHMVLKGMQAAQEVESFTDDLEGKPRYRLAKPADVSLVDTWLTGTGGGSAEDSSTNALIRRSKLNHFGTLYDLYNTSSGDAPAFYGADAAVHAHRAHDAGKTAAQQAAAAQNAYNPALHIDTDKKKEK